MNLKYLREYYEKTAGFMVLISAILIVVVSSLAVLIAGEAVNAGEDYGTSYNIFSLTFIVGMFLLIFALIAGFLGFKSKSEGSTTFTKFSSFFNGIIGLFFTGDIIYMMISKKAIWNDLYTRNIFLISLISGVLLVVYSLGAFVYSLKSRRYYDRKKAAKELPDITVERTKDIYYGIMAFTSDIFWVSSALMAYFMSNQIAEYIKINSENIRWQSKALNAVFIIGLTVAGILFVLSIIKIAGIKAKAVNIAIMAVYALETVASLAVVIITISMIGSLYVKAGYPDITYMIFTYAVIAIAEVLSIGVFKAVLPSQGQN